MKKILGSILIVLAMCVSVCFAADMTQSVKIDQTTLAEESVISLSDAKTKTVTASGTYEKGAFVSLEIKNKTTNEVVLSQQAACKDDATFSIGGIMSDDVKAGSYVLTIGATGMTNAVTYNFSVQDTAVEKPKADVTISVVGGKASVKKGNDMLGENITEKTEKYEVGTVLTLTATADDNTKEFLYWQDTNTKTIISTSETVNITVGSKGSYVAVYADKVSSAGYYVTFKSNGMVVAQGTGISVPRDPFIAGYTFAGWYTTDGDKTELKASDDVEVSENTTYLAGYTKNDVKYEVKATNAKTSVDGNYEYNATVSVTAADSENSKVFSCWKRTDKDGNNATIVSYSETYSFFVDGDTYLTAEYAASKPEEAIVLVMSNPVMADSTRIAFYAERSIPAKYTVIENGILLNQSAEFDIDTNGVLKAKSSKTSKTGKFTVRKANVSAGDTWYAKAYVIYSDGVNVYTAYSNTVSKTAE